MDFKEIITILNRIEKDIQIESLVYKGLNIWPLIRLYLCQNMRTQNHCPQNPWQTSIHKSPEELKVKYHHYVDYYARLQEGLTGKFSSTTPRTVLFYSFSDVEIKLIDQVYYNIYIDPIRELLDEMGISHFCVQSFSRSFSPLCFDVAKISELLRVRHSLSLMKEVIGNMETENWKSNLIHLPHEYWHLKEIITKNSCQDYFFEDRRFIYEFETFFELQEMFEFLLQLLKPELCFFTQYYDFNNMALIRACNCMRIKTVDIQHGAQGKYQIYYTHWSNVPAEGFDTLPNFFWSWGEANVNYFKQWNSAVHNNHIALAGGNLWIAGQRRKTLHQTLNQSGNLPDGMQFEINCIESDYTEILFTLQPSPPVELFPQILIDAINESPSGFKWYLRLHPLILNNPESLECVRRIYSENGWNQSHVKLEHVDRVPLYDLLAHIDYHVTQISTVSYEAELFGKPTIIIGGIGMRIMDEEIDPGYFLYAHDSKELIQIIADRKKGNPRPIPFIETDLKKARETMTAILKQANARLSEG